MYIIIYNIIYIRGYTSINIHIVFVIVVVISVSIILHAYIVVEVEAISSSPITFAVVQIID